jgi:hypothetical protein
MEQGGAYMALLVLTLDEPIGIAEEQWEAYSKTRATWIQTLLKQPGVQEFRAYVNPRLATPQAMGTWEFDSLASIHTYLGSELANTLTTEMRAMGCTSITYQIWDNSPVIPEPLKAAR